MKLQTEKTAGETKKRKREEEKEREDILERNEKSTLREQVELFRKRWLIAAEREKTVESFFTRWVNGVDEMKRNLRILRGEEEENEDWRLQAAIRCRQSQPTQGDLPEDIAMHVRLTERRCLASITLASVGTPFPLKRLQLTKLIEHYGGHLMSL